ncbi:MAG TPA: hypothetical protein VFO33_05965 [Casimicrobiaceae bacterium]|nr:hypothetical protein [Casimicrobiaceae bacterium]
MQRIAEGWLIVRQAAKKFGPYLMLELLLPGGTLWALLLFAARRAARGE